MRNSLFRPLSQVGPIGGNGTGREVEASNIAPATPAAPTTSRMNLAALVAAGILAEDDRVEARLYGVTHFGRVHDGGIEVEGVLYATPSAAASALRGGKASNGWVIGRIVVGFWSSFGTNC